MGNSRVTSPESVPIYMYLNEVPQHNADLNKGGGGGGGGGGVTH